MSDRLYKIAVMADLHGHLPDVQTSVDVVCIAGDIEPLQYSSNPPTRNGLKKSAEWLFTKFYPWMGDLIARGKARHVVYTWGNHDWVPFYLLHKAGVPPPDGCHELVDSGVVLDGMKFWGSPWQLPFYDWAYNLPEDLLAERWAEIPLDTDVLITHSPPHGLGDQVGRSHVGSVSLLDRIKEVEPQIVGCGHIHVGYGSYQVVGNSGKTTHVYNAALTDSRYRLTREPVVVECDRH